MVRASIPNISGRELKNEGESDESDNSP
jgi:hypothetical protein